MLWMGTAVTLGAAIVVMAALLVTRSTSDLGSVSDRWVAEHRLESPVREGRTWGGAWRKPSASTRQVRPRPGAFSTLRHAR